LSDLLDPATLTPESLYKLQSETWMQGVEFERQRIIKLLIDKAIQWRGEKLHQQADYIDFAIDLIKGEQK
jgi:hypothetical protein